MRGFPLKRSDAAVDGSQPEARAQPLCAQVFRGYHVGGGSQNHRDNSISFNIVAGSDDSHSFKITIHPSDDWPLCLHLRSVATYRMAMGIPVALERRVRPDHKGQARTARLTFLGCRALAKPITAGCVTFQNSKAITNCYKKKIEPHAMGSPPPFPLNHNRVSLA